MSDQADRTLWVGNLDPRVTDELLFELFLQAGPLQNVNVAKGKEGNPKGFAFVEFKHDVSVPYSMQLMRGLALFSRPLRLQFRSGSKHQSAPQPMMPSTPPMQSPGYKGGSGGMGLLGTPVMQGDGGGRLPPPIHRSASAPGGVARIGGSYHGSAVPLMATHLSTGSPILQGPPGNMQRTVIGLPPGTPFSQGAALQGMPLSNRRDQSPTHQPTPLRNTYDTPDRRGSDSRGSSNRNLDGYRDDNQGSRDRDYSPRSDEGSRDFNRQRGYGRDDGSDFRGRDRGRYNEEARVSDLDGRGGGSQDGYYNQDRQGRDQGRYRDRSGGRNEGRRGYDDGHRRNYHSGR